MEPQVDVPCESEVAVSARAPEAEPESSAYEVEPENSVPEDAEAPAAPKAAPVAGASPAPPRVPQGAPQSLPLRTLLLSLEKVWSVAQEQALALAVALHGSGRYDVRLCCPPDSTLAERARQQDASLPLVALSSPRHLPTLFRLWRCQQRKQPLLMHCFDPDALQLAERLTRVRRPGSTVLLHSCFSSPVLAPREESLLPQREDGVLREGHEGNPGREEATGARASASVPAYFSRKGSAHKGWHLADRILCANGFVRAQLADNGLDVARLSVVHPGLDAAALPLRRQRADGRFVFVAAEHLQQGSGLFVLLRAMAALWQRTDLPPWEVRVVGAGDAFMAILDEARSLGVESRLALLSRQDWGEVLPRCDALLVPNRQPCGNVRALMAAWCCALPLVCTDVASHGEVLRAAGVGHGFAVDAVTASRAAMPVPTGDAQALAAAMIRLLTEPDLCARLALQEASMCAYAGHARMVAQTLVHYEDCVSRQGWALPPLHAPEAPAAATPETAIPAAAATAAAVAAPEISPSSDPDAE